MSGDDSWSGAGAATSGSKTLTAKGTTTLSDLTVGGTTTFSDAGSLSESGGVGERTLASGAAKHTFDFAGTFTAGSFNIASGTTTVITHT